MNQTRWFRPWKTAGGSILFVSQPELVLFAARVHPGAWPCRRDRPPPGACLAWTGDSAAHGRVRPRAAHSRVLNAHCARPRPKPALRMAASDPALRTAVS